VTRDPRRALILVDPLQRSRRLTVPVTCSRSAGTLRMFLAQLQRSRRLTAPVTSTIELNTTACCSRLQRSRRLPAPVTIERRVDDAPAGHASTEPAPSGAGDALAVSAVSAT